MEGLDWLKMPLLSGIGGKKPQWWGTGKSVVADPDSMSWWLRRMVFDFPITQILLLVLLIVIVISC